MSKWNKSDLNALWGVFGFVAFFAFMYVLMVIDLAPDVEVNQTWRSGEMEVKCIEPNKLDIFNPWAFRVSVLTHEWGHPHDFFHIPSGSHQKFPVKAGLAFYFYDDKGALIGFIKTY